MISATEKHTPLNPKFFNRFDGLTTRGITSVSLSLCDSRGRLFFTLIDGFALSDPQKISTNTTKPILNIEKIILDDEIVYPQKNSVIEIPAGTRRVNVEFSGLSFVSSEPVRYLCHLEGFDKKQPSWTVQNVASYTNLLPGKYNLHIIARNGNKIESDENSEIVFVQKAFLYQKLWFWILIGVLILAFIVHLSFSLSRVFRQLRVLKVAISELSSGNADLTKRISMKKRSEFKIFDELVLEENRFLEKFQGIIAKVKNSERKLGENK